MGSARLVRPDREVRLAATGARTERLLLVGLASAALTAGACTSREGAAVPTGTASAATQVGAVVGVPGHEVRATSRSMETWALLYEAPPWRAGREVKVVWRSTGRGDLRVVAVGPRSQTVPPVSGPTPHHGSNWGRPGDEWGTSFRLDEPGRWLLQVEQGPATASLPLLVVR